MRQQGGGDGLVPGQAAKIADAILSEPSTLDDAAARDLSRAMGGKVDTTKADRWNMARDTVNAKTKKARKNRHLDGYARKENVS